MALAHYIGYAENASTGKPLKDVVIRVYSSTGNVLQSVFADISGTPKPVVSSDDNGAYDFYIADGNYDIEHVYNGVILTRIVRVAIANPDNYKESGDFGAFGATLVANETVAEARADLGLEEIRISHFPGADPTGVTNSAAAINAAIVEAQATGRPINVDGRYLHNTQIVVPANVVFIGYGVLVSDKSQRSRSCFIKNFDGVGFLFSGDHTGTNGVQYDSVVGKTGDNVQVTGTRWQAPSICATNAGGDNIRIGATEAGPTSINANLWYIGRLHSYGAGGRGIKVDHTNTTTSATFPLGAPDCGGGTLVSADIRDNGNDGIELGNTIDNQLGAIFSQQNGGYGMRFSAGAWKNTVAKLYEEDNAVPGVIFDSGVKQNVIRDASRAASLAAFVTDNSGNKSNRVDGHNSNVGDVVSYDIAPMYHGGSFYQRTTATTSEHVQYVGANVVGGRWRVDEDGATGTKITFVTRTNGFGNEDKVSISQAGDFDILKAGAVLKMNGVSVLAGRGAAIADAVNSVAAPTKAEFDALVAVTNTILARMRALTPSIAT